MPPTSIKEVFLSTPSARRATFWQVDGTTGRLISIHALREEGDAAHTAAGTASHRFLSTPSARRATDVRQLDAVDFEFLSTPSARRATDTLERVRSRRRFLSTPSARRATCGAGATLLAFLFLSTPSARRATHSFFATFCFLCYFYPRPPRGGRLDPLPTKKAAAKFLSTPSARRATTVSLQHFVSSVISIHALREEGDSRYPGVMRKFHYFYPRPPRGGRQQKQRQNLYFQTNYTTFCTNLEEP